MRKYLKDHAIKALQAFDAEMGKSSHFGLPLDTHLRNYCKQYKSRRPIMSKKSVQETERSWKTQFSMLLDTVECLKS